MLPTGVWDQTDQDVTRVLEGMRKAGMMELTEQAKYRCKTQNIDMDAPYLFFQNKKAHDSCHIWFDVLFLQFSVIPAYCQRNCYKVVVKCADFAEFWKSYGIVEALGENGKGGADPRDYTGCGWPIFVYTHSLEKGKEAWKRVTEALGPDMAGKVILKKGCTEMEMRTPLARWACTPSQKKLEAQVLERIEFDTAPVIIQPDWLRRHKVREWVRKAHSVGDMSYKQIWGDAPLFIEPVTFHG